jgi:hypothetical protein
VHGDRWAIFLLQWVKHPSFKDEDEYRIVHSLEEDEIVHLQFRQKQSLMSRHFPLVFCPSNTLPIVEVMVGPSRHKEISRISVETLLRQKGYPASDQVTMSDIPFQTT